MVLEERLYLSAITHYTISCNIPLYHDTKEVYKTKVTGTMPIEFSHTTKSFAYITSYSYKMKIFIIKTLTSNGICSDHLILSFGVTIVSAAV